MDYLVSVIVPVYNVEKYLRECLDSIIAQIYKKIEVILVNDGSTDDSLKICKEYVAKDSRVFLIDKINEGLSIARQTGIDNCKGQYFCTVDSDDRIDPSYVEKLLRCITTYEADIALCAVYETLPDGACKKVVLPKDLDEKCHIFKDLLENEYSHLLGKYQMSDSWNKMYRTAFVKDSGIKFKLPKIYNGTDLLFNHLLLLHEPTIAVVNEHLYYYRIIQNSRVRRKDKHLEKGFRIILDYLLEENQKTIGTVEMRYQIYAEYLNMLKYATQDYYTEHRELGKISICKGFKDIYSSMPELSKCERKQILARVENNLKIFCFLLLNQNANGMYIFYKARDVLRGMK